MTRKTGPDQRFKHDNTTKQTAAGIESRLAATFLLTRVIDDGRNLDALCDRKHGINKFLSLSERDQSLARAITITALRNRNRIEFVFKKLMNRPPPKNARFLLHSLHIAAAQILFMDVPERAAVNIAVEAIGKDKRTVRFKDLTNAVLRRMTREKAKLVEASENISPFPGWLEKMQRSNYGKENLTRIAEAASKPSALDITVKSDAEDWARELGGTLLPTGSIRVESTAPVMTLPGYGEGHWWVQDAAAALPARLVIAEPGARVLELCAAPGGKTAQLVNSGYQVTALDVSEPRLVRLEENLNRLNLSANTVMADALEWEVDTPFDAVLLDAPCSSTGTVRRHPDVLWTRNRQEIHDLAELQYRLICRAAQFVRPGGCLVFSNCSMLKEEGENLLGKVLAACPELSVSPIQPDEIAGTHEMINGQGALRSQPFHLANRENPALGGLDGFFACRFVKSDS